MAELVMPKLGADMTAGTLVAWLRQPGEQVRRGDVVAQVDTDKGVIDIEVFATGVLQTILVSPGQTVAVGTPLAIIQEVSLPPVEQAPPVSPTGAASPACAAPPGHDAARAHEPPVAIQMPAAIQMPVAEPSESPPSTVPQVGVPPTATKLAEPAAPGGSAAAPGGRVPELTRLRISPSARELARALGVDPAAVRGTGRGGAITREDIQRAAAQASATADTPPAPLAAPAVQAWPAAQVPASDRTVRMRQAIAAAMSRSKREIPHYYLGTTIDLHRAMTWLAAENEARPLKQRLLYGALLLKAVALALREFPELNGFWNDGAYQQSHAIHLGVAISLRQGGLIAPALHHADQLDLGTLMERLRDLVQRARSGSLRGSELSDPTITITSLGEQGVEMVFPVIYPPQVAIVGFGKIVERACVVGGQVVVRPTITATLAADHRASDGHRGGLFLSAIERLLQQPESL